MGVLKYHRDGPVSASALDKILTEMDSQAAAAFEELGEAFATRFESMDAEIRKLRAEIETERRLRLGGRK